MLEKKLEETRKKSWEDPIMVTECVWARCALARGASQAGGAAGKRSWAVRDGARRALLCQCHKWWLWDSGHSWTTGETLLRLASWLF